MSKRLHATLLISSIFAYNVIFGVTYYFNLTVLDFLNNRLHIMISFLLFITSMYLLYSHYKKYGSSLLTTCAFIGVIITGLPFLTLAMLNLIAE